MLYVTLAELCLSVSYLLQFLNHFTFITQSGIIQMASVSI